VGARREREDVAGPDGGYTAPLLRTQDVQLLVVAAVGGRSFTLWYRDASDLAHGQSVSIPTSGTKVLDIPVG
jgi:hypothetical protein